MHPSKTTNRPGIASDCAGGFQARTAILLALLVTAIFTLLAMAPPLHAAQESPGSESTKPLNPAPSSVSNPQGEKAHYVGSESCKGCHLQAYNGWKKTRMANVLRDPKEHPEAVIGDFKSQDPIRTFTLDDVAFVYGSRFKQRYFTKRGDDYFPLPAQWDVQKKRWLPYHVESGTDWWVPFYGPTNFDRPTGPTCDGCHSVNYDIHNGQVTEWNVGCEKCHGPGSLHVAHPTRKNIVNPATLDPVRGNDVCIQCHSQGRPLSNPINGRYYDWPVGFTAGERLSDYWNLEELKPGTTDFFQFADLTAHKNRMQGNDFVQSLMYHRQMRCFDCHQVHSEAVSNLPLSGNQLCLSCHDKQNPAGLRGTVSEHTHHADRTAPAVNVSPATCHA